MSSELLSFLDGPDLYPPAFDAEFSWPEDTPARLVETLRDAPPATFGLAVVPDPPAPAPKLSLRAHIEGVDAIAQTVEDLDPEDLDDAAREELSAMLIKAIAGTKRKVDDTSRVLAMFEHLEAAAQCERDRLDTRAKYFARQAQRLTDYVLATLDASKLDRLDGETSTLRRRKNPAKALPDATTIGPLAPEFVRPPKAMPWEPQKDLIKAAIASGRSVPGWAAVRTFKLVRS